MNISPEDFADAVVVTLTRDLPAALAAQQTRYAAADAAAGRVIPLAPPAAEDYYPGGVDVVTKYPTVEVAAPDLMVTNFDIDMYDADAEFALIVRHWQQAAVFDVLYRQVSRTSAAIVTALVAPRAISDGKVIAIRGAWRFNPETDTRDSIISGAVLALTVATVLRRS